MQNLGTFEEHLRSIQKAFARGQIRSDEEICFDQYLSHLKGNRLSSEASVLSRNTGKCTSAVLKALLETKQHLELLFLGPGSGYECFDAQNMIHDRGGTCYIDTIALTPFAPDIAPHHDIKQHTLIPPFVRHQWIGKFPYISGVPQGKYNIVSDQLGALFYASTKDPSRAIKTAYAYANPNFGFIVNEVIHAHPDSILIDDDADPREKQFEEWENIKAPEDTFIRSDQSAILIRGAQPLIGDVPVFPSTVQMCSAVRDICKKLCIK